MLGKIMKNALLTLLTLLFIVAAILFQSAISLNATLFSKDFFARNLDRSGIDVKLVEFTDNAIDNIEMLKGDNQDSQGESNDQPISPEGQKYLDSLKKNIRDNVDAEWIKTEIPKTVKGIDAYFLTGGELPVVNIKPLKEGLTNAIVQTIMEKMSIQSHDLGTNTLAAMRETILKNSPEKNVTDKAIDEILSQNQIKQLKISREAVTNLTQAVAKSENLTIEQFLKLATTEMAREKIGYYQIKDELDLKQLFEVQYGSKDNPVSGMAKLIANIRGAIWKLIITLFITLLLGICLCAFRIKSILRWVGAGMLLSGLILIGQRALATVSNAKLVQGIKGAMENSKGLDLNFLQNWIVLYLNELWQTFALVSIGFMLTGIVLIIVSFGLDKLRRKSSVNPRERVYKTGNKSNSVGNRLLRALAIIILLISIPVNISSAVTETKKSVEDYNRIKAAAAINTIDSNKALGIVLNAQLLLTQNDDNKR